MTAVIRVDEPAEDQYIHLRFTCPECGGDELTEHLERSYEAHTPFTSMSYCPISDCAYLGYEEACEDTKFKQQSFSCSQCGYEVQFSEEILENCRNEQEALAKWLIANCEQEDSYVPRERSREVVLTFTCPKCNGNRLHNITTGPRYKHTIEGITPDGEVVFGDSELDGSIEHWFQCGDCGYVLKDDDNSSVNGPDGLLHWMRDQND